MSVLIEPISALKWERPMISSGRYLYHLQDIAEIKAMPQPVNSTQQMRLKSMEAEAAEFEKANPDEAKRLQARAKELAA